MLCVQIPKEDERDSIHTLVFLSFVHVMYVSACSRLCFLLVEEVNRRKYLAQARQPRYGYITRPSSVGRPTSEESAWVQNWANITPTHTISPAVPVSSGPTAQPQVCIEYIAFQCLIIGRMCTHHELSFSESYTR